MKLIFKLVPLGFLFLISGINLHAQNISGTVNIYTNVTALASNTVTVGNSAGFSVGDKVLLIQMKGASITTGNVSTFGTVTAYNNAGNYEYLTVASIAGNNITMTTSLCQTYTIAGAVQLIRVPVYTNPNISGNITCVPWNGIVGGVVAFEATGTVTFNANINVGGSGFRGGQVGNGGFSCNDPSYADATKGKKGEGIAVAPAGQDANRAPLANGGGGSNTGNPGAGGGGNYGTGGRGGDEFSGQCVTTSFGIGGYALTTNSAKIFLGGGGGGGFWDNGLTCTDGTNGGGIVMIKANQITGNGFTIQANGVDQTINSDSEGAGGGGAGGAVYLWCPSYTTALNINIKGGNGGNINNFLWNGYCHGPGGGGGGGYVWFSNAATPGGVVINNAGGNPGIVMNSGPCLGTPNQATAGQSGGTLFNLPVPAPPLPLANLGNDTNICPGQTLTLQTDTVYPSYTWSTGAVTPTINIAATGTYWVDVPIGCGTIDRDTIVVTVGTANVNLGPDQNICSGDSVQFNAGAGFANYVWNTGDSTVSIYVNSIGTYIVAVTDTAGCTDADTAEILNISPLPVINLGPDTTQCSGNILLNAGAGFVNYLWQNGSSASSLNVTTNGTYWVLVNDANNCSNADTINITVFPLPNFSLGPDFGICPGDSIEIFPIGPFVPVTYSWNNASTGSSLIINDKGTYTLTVTDNNSCTYSDTLLVSVHCPPTIYVPNTFTPNADEINQVFMAYGTNIREFKMEIFNRWGQLIFTIDDIAQGWDGTINGNPVPMGQYIYKITYQDYLKVDDKYLMGEVNLIR